MPRKDVLDHLSRLYAASDDPWHHRSSAYEAEKYDMTLAAIGQGPFRLALEIGCGNGTLARRLAPRCRHLTVMECIPAAARLARTALADMAQVTVIQGAAPQELPDSSGPVVAVNWTGPTDEPLDGPGAVDLLAGFLGQPRTSDHDAYRIDLFHSCPTGTIRAAGGSP